MNMKLISMELTDFKGCRNAKYAFAANTTIVGENGSGKTTIADAFYWVFFDKNYALNSNPNIRPNDGRECTPKVQLELEVDGKTISVAKMQKEKVSKPDANGIVKRTLTNSYEINAVPKTERDFKEHLSELNVDFDKFLQLSHPDLFIAGMNEKKTREQIRNTLFEMAGSMPDLKIAQMTEGVSDVAKLLEQYSREEIEAMQNATLRKIRENYGKDGEILRAKIEGLESAKVDVDVAEMEIGKRGVKELIEANKEKQASIDKQLKEYQELSDGVLELKFQISDFQRNANSEHLKKIKELQKQIDDKTMELVSLNNSDDRNNREIAACVEEIEKIIKKRNVLAELWKGVNAEKFDESTTVCPTCNRELPEEEIRKLMTEFESRKAERIKKVEADGNKEKKNLEELKSKKEKLELHKDDNEVLKHAIEKEINRLDEELKSMPVQVDISQDENYKNLIEQIREKEKAMDDFADVKNIRQQLVTEYEELQEQLTQYEREIAISDNNERIDDQIIDLRKMQAEYEQSKANCEKILEQLKLLSKKKNELLTIQINNQFDIVEWQLFDYQKNGEYKEICVPKVDGKRFGESTNKGREILAKLDIVKGLQRFYSQHYPVFLDNAESLSANTNDRIKMNCQMISMNVAEQTLSILFGRE